jgi:hypothetical protein
MLARQLNRTLAPVDYEVIGSNLRDGYKSKNDGELYKGPQWFTNNANDDIYKGIYR